jgi:hypothetical protein
LVAWILGLPRFQQRNSRAAGNRYRDAPCTFLQAQTRHIVKALYAKKMVFVCSQWAGIRAVSPGLGMIHGLALIALGVMLFGLQAMFYMTPKQVVTGPPESPTTKVGHETYPAPGILGLMCLTAGVAILATRRRADELEAKNAV